MLKIVGRGGIAGRTYRSFLLDGIDTIGVTPGEEYSIVFTPSGRDTYSRTKILVSVDGINPRTGQPAVDDPMAPGYTTESGQPVTIANWSEDSRGGGGLVFGTPEYAVGSYKTAAEGSALGYISVIVYVEDGRPAYLHPPTFSPASTSGYEAPDYGGELLKLRPRSAGAGADTQFNETLRIPSVGTGVGPRVETQGRMTHDLLSPRYAGLEQIRYMLVSDLTGRLPQHPTGFQSRPMADLSGVPRMDQGPVQFITPGVSRFA